MRLLNVHTLEFQEFHGSDHPAYVITSHRWIGDEITFQQFRDREVQPQITETPGYKKVLSFCEFMRVWGEDISCPPRNSDEPNSKGDCGQCFSRRFKCDKRRPKCENCSHDGLACEYNIPRAANIPDPKAPDSAGVRQNRTLQAAGSQNMNKSCKACATANRICSKEKPACRRCQQHGLECDYGTALAGGGGAENHEEVTDLQWIWIDTCCIDKSSSAELGEAINSMFRWYADAYACLAYMQDVRPRNFAPSTILLDFKNSSWFTRGWTLQELLAPSLVVFLNRNWEVFGHKAGPVGSAVQMSVSKIKMPLNPWISRISGIKESVLLDYSTMKDLSMEERLRWMDGRTTTRIEDKAYCLLGICDVFMPLIYGEGERACDRLEETINKESTGLKTKVYGLRHRLMSKAGQTRDEVTPYEVLDHPDPGTTIPYPSSEERKLPWAIGLSSYYSDPYDPLGYSSPQFLPPPPPSPQQFAGRRDPASDRYGLLSDRDERVNPDSPHSWFNVEGENRTRPRRERENNAIDSMMGGYTTRHDPVATARTERPRNPFDSRHEPRVSRQVDDYPRVHRPRSHYNSSLGSLVGEPDTSAKLEYEQDDSLVDFYPAEPAARRKTMKVSTKRSSRASRRKHSSSTKPDPDAKEKTEARKKGTDHQETLRRLEEKVNQLSADLQAQREVKVSPGPSTPKGDQGSPTENKFPSTPPPKRPPTSLSSDHGFQTPIESRSPALSLRSSDSDGRKYRVVLEELSPSIDGMLAATPLQRHVLGETSPLTSPHNPTTPAEYSHRQTGFTDRPFWPAASQGQSMPPGSFPQWTPSSPAFPSQAGWSDGSVPSAQRQFCAIM